MPQQMLFEILDACSEWNTKSVTFLGGEPSLYPDLHRALIKATELGLHTRIVTNGSAAFEKFAKNYSDLIKNTHVCFSVDGSNEKEHDPIRRQGSFRELIKSIDLCQQLGVATTGIVSLNRANLNDASAILQTCHSLGLHSLNIHYVTARGCCDAGLVPTISEWRLACKILRDEALRLQISIRLEDTFVPKVGFKGGCAVRERSNLMFFPDGKVFMCLLFLDVPHSHAFEWTSGGLVSNPSKSSELLLSEESSDIHCPAFHLVDPVLASKVKSGGFIVTCIYKKTLIDVV